MDQQTKKTSNNFHSHTPAWYCQRNHIKCIFCLSYGFLGHHRPRWINMMLPDPPVKTYWIKISREHNKILVRTPTLNHTQYLRHKINSPYSIHG